MKSSDELVKWYKFHLKKKCFTNLQWNLANAPQPPPNCFLHFSTAVFFLSTAFIYTSPDEWILLRYFFFIFYLHNLAVTKEDCILPEFFFYWKLFLCMTKNIKRRKEKDHQLNPGFKRHKNLAKYHCWYTNNWVMQMTSK